MVIISHDRTFLDKVTDQTWEITLGRIDTYKGNYTYYLKEKAERRAIEKGAFDNQQAKIKQTQRFVDRFRAKSTKAKQVQSRVKQLEKLELLELGEENRQINFSFPPAPDSGRDILTIESLSKSFDGKPVFKDVDLQFQRGDKVAVVGGGNVAIDAARVSKRMGAEVTILYRRRVQDMPADWEEIEGAEHEDVNIHPQAIPLEVISDKDGKVTSVKYANAEMVADDKGGRPRPVMIEGDEHILPITTIIGAIGQEADYSFIPDDIKEQIEISRGRIVVDENQATSLPWLFATGDIANRQADAISAIADGYRAVKSIEKLLLKK